MNDLFLAYSGDGKGGGWGGILITFKSKLLSNSVPDMHFCFVTLNLISLSTQLNTGQHIQNLLFKEL